MKKYELIVIFKPLLPQDIREGVEKKIANFLKDANCKVISTDVWGKKHLAYEIKGHEDGYYVVYNLEVEKDASKLDGIGTKFSMITEILRYMLVEVE